MKIKENTKIGKELDFQFVINVIMMNMILKKLEDNNGNSNFCYCYYYYYQ